MTPIVKMQNTKTNPNATIMVVLSNSDYDKITDEEVLELASKHKNFKNVNYIIKFNDVYKTKQAIFK